MAPKLTAPKGTKAQALYTRKAQAAATLRKLDRKIDRLPFMSPYRKFLEACYVDVRTSYVSVEGKAA